MKKLIAAIFAIALLAGMATFVSPAGAGPGKGQKIGQDEVRKALTQCSNAGVGNGGEYEAALIVYSVVSDCLHKKLFDRYSSAEIDAILAQASACLITGLVNACEIDPGNSGAHNNADSNA